MFQDIQKITEQSQNVPHNIYTLFETAQNTFFCKRWAIRKLKYSLHLYYTQMLKISFSLPDFLTGEIHTYLAQRLSRLVSVRFPGV